MKLINLNSKSCQLEKGLEIMQLYWNKLFNTKSIDIEIIANFDDEIEGYFYTFEDSTFRINYSHISSFFRGMTYFFSTRENSFSEKRQFKELSLSLDLSRNAVMNENYIKKFLCRLASLGYDTCFLYMEDVYELKKYPYFGYLRGRYSENFLKELDDYANKLGIELIPSIQTLSHLERPLKWHVFNDIKDTDTSLKVYEEHTYKLIDEMIKTMSTCFRSERIHLGMDEALQLGQGEFLKSYPYETQENLFIYHLKKVLEIVKKYKKCPLIWSDMLLRVLSNTGEYYDTQVEINDEYAQILPDLDLIYWDYYHSDIEDYEQIIDKHLKMTKSLYFAGGIWIFNGIAPNHGRMLQNTFSALEACKNKNITHIMATTWLDDGAETPIYASFLGLQLFAEGQYHNNMEISDVKYAFKVFQNENYEEHFLLNKFDQTPGTKENNPYSSAISKIILYQDTLLGLFDVNIEGLQLEKHYKQLHLELTNCVTKSTLFNHYKKIAYILSVKVELGCNIAQAYKNKDLNQLNKLLNDTLELIDLYKDIEKSHLDLWLETNKKIGWEVISRRYYSVIAHLTNTARELTKKVNESEYIIEELEETKLLYSDWYTEIDGCIATNSFEQIVTVNKM